MSSFACERQRQLAHLVEEERSPARHLHQPAAGGLGVGERPLLVAEELGLHRGLGQRRAVHVNERSVVARPERVDVAREHLLAGAGGAEEEHRAARRGGDALQHLQHLLHRGRLRRDEPAAPGQLGLHAAQALAEVLLAHRSLGTHDQVGQVHRLGHVVGGPGADGVHRALDVPVRGDHHYRGAGELRLQLGEVVEPVAIGKPAIQDHQLGSGALDRHARLVERARQHHRVPLAGERRLRQRGKATVVVDHKDGPAHEGVVPSPSCTVKRLPVAVRSNASDPPCRSTACRAMESPSPMPLGLDVTKG